MSYAAPHSIALFTCSSVIPILAADSSDRPHTLMCSLTCSAVGVVNIALFASNTFLQKLLHVTWCESGLVSNPLKHTLQIRFCVGGSGPPRCHRRLQRRLVSPHSGLMQRWIVETEHSYCSAIVASFTPTLNCLSMSSRSNGFIFHLCHLLSS